MSSIRRGYIYLVSAISLQAVAWAIIALLRNLFVFGIDPVAVAFQIAVIVIGLPVNMDGTIGPAAKAVEAFVELLQKEVGLPVDTFRQTRHVQRRAAGRDG